MYLLVDPADHATPITTENGGQPLIRKPGETSFSNTDGLLIHTGYGHYISYLTTNEIDTLGAFSIIYENLGVVDIFQDHARVIVESGEISLDEVNAKLLTLETRLKEIEYKIDLIDDDVKPEPFLNPL